MCCIVLLYNDCIVTFIDSVTIFMWGAGGYVTTYCADLYLWEIPRARDLAQETVTANAMFATLNEHPLNELHLTAQV